jgi:hypothetical protein
MLCASRLVFDGTEGVGPVFMFCAPKLVLSGTEGARSSFHVMRSQTRFRRYRGRQEPFLCFALTDSFSAVLRALGRVFMFCAPGLVFLSAEGAGSSFQILRSRTHFLQYRGRRVLLSCFAPSDSF